MGIGREPDRHRLLGRQILNLDFTRLPIDALDVSDFGEERPEHNLLSRNALAVLVAARAELIADRDLGFAAWFCIRELYRIRSITADFRRRGEDHGRVLRSEQDTLLERNLTAALR